MRARTSADPAGPQPLTRRREASDPDRQLMADEHGLVAAAASRASARRRACGRDLPVGLAPGRAERVPGGAR